MPGRRKSKGERVDLVSVNFYEQDRELWDKAQGFSELAGRKNKSSSIIWLIKQAVEYLEKYPQPNLEQRVTELCGRLAVTANKTPIEITHTNSDGQIDLEESIEEVTTKDKRQEFNRKIKDESIDPGSLREDYSDLVTAENKEDDENALAIPPWLDRREIEEETEEEIDNETIYQSWSELELTQHIETLESLNRSDKQNQELLELYEELETRGE